MNYDLVDLPGIIIQNQVINNGFHQCCLTPKRKSGFILLLFIVAAMGVVSIIFPRHGEGAESRIEPGLTVGQEYNDNIFLTTQNRSSDFISRLAPSIDLLYNSALWDWDVRASYEYRYYNRFHDYVKQSDIPYLNLANHTRIKDEYMFIDVKDIYSKSSLYPTRDYTQESAFVNQSDTNVLTVNPYFLVKPTSKMTVTTGYTYLNTWYKDPRAIDQVAHTVYTGFQQDMSLRTSIMSGVRHTQNYNSMQDYIQDDVYIGDRYEYVENSILYLSIGNTWFNVKDAERISQVTWDANLTHHYSTMTVIFETGLRFIPEPLQTGSIVPGDIPAKRQDRYLATIRRDVERTSLIAYGGLLEYRNIINKHLENSTYLISGSISHALSTKSKIILNLEADWYRDYVTSAQFTRSERYLTGARYEYLAAQNMTLAFYYNYTNVYSPDVYTNNYFNNRYTVELRMVF